MRKFTLILSLLVAMVTTAMAQTIAGVTEVPTTATAPANLTTGYYFLKETNTGAATSGTQGYIKAASDAVGANVSTTATAPVANKISGLYIWYIEVADDGSFTIATANKTAYWQAPYEGKKTLAAEGGTLRAVTTETTLGGSTATPTEGTAIISNNDGTALVHYSGGNLGSWTDANPASVWFVEFFNIPEANLLNLSDINFELSTEKVYNIQSVDGTSIFPKDDNYLYTKAADASDWTQLWVPIKSSTGSTYALRNASTGDYLTHTAGDSQHWKVSATEDYLYIGVQQEATLTSEPKYYISYAEITDVNTASRTAAHNNGWASWGWSNSYVVTWDQNAEKSMWYFVESEVSIDEVREEWNSAITITYSYTYNGTEVASEEYTLKAGDALPATNVPYPYEMTGTAPSGEVTTAQTYTIECNNVNLPFVVTDDLNNPVWQVVEMHRYGTFRIWEFDAVDAAVKVTDYASEKENAVSDACLWCFTGNILDGFKIYNKAAGTEYTLNATATTPTVGTAVDGNNVWKFKASTATSSPAACFTSDGSNCMNHSGGLIKYYSQADNGSTCYFDSTPSTFAIEAADAIYDTPVGVIGSYIISDDNASALQNAYDASAAATDDLAKAQALAAAVKAIRSGDIIEYTDGYYRIISAQPGLYANSKGLYFDGSTFAWGTVANSNVNAIVKLTTDNEKVVLQNPNSALYMQGVAGASNAEMTENGHITLTALGCGQYNLVFGNGTMHANNHGGGSGSGSSVINYPGDINSASAWYLVPATELEVSLSDVAGEGWATIHLPFDVTLNEGLTAYYGKSISSSNDELVLAELSSIPANNGVILYSQTAGAHILNIATASDEIESNVILGTNVSKEIAAGNNYILANGANGIGLYIVDEDPDTEGYEAFTMGANKAYLSIAGEAASNGFSFRIEGTTAIDEVEAAEAGEQVIYDLTGRRVESISAPGIYIVNGKKVVVK